MSGERDNIGNPQLCRYQPKTNQKRTIPGHHGLFLGRQTHRYPRLPQSRSGVNIPHNYDVAGKAVCERRVFLITRIFSLNPSSCSSFFLCLPAEEADKSLLFPLLRMALKCRRLLFAITSCKAFFSSVESSRRPTSTFTSASPKKSALFCRRSCKSERISEKSASSRQKMITPSFVPLNSILAFLPPA